MRASVIGRCFELPLLLATAASAEGAVVRALERACSLQLIVTDEAGRRRYSFRHAITREIIYAELLAARVRALHRRIARALERSAAPGPAPLEDLAYHYWAGGDARRTLHYNELAGDSAAALHAASDAHAFYTRARSFIEVGSPDYARLSAKLHAVRS